MPNQPEAVLYSGKYGSSGLYTAESLNPDIPSHLAQKLCSAANFSLSKASWSSYKTAGSQLQLCCTETNRDLSFPFNETKALIFTGWLIDKEVSHATINKYLSGVRQLHLAAGHQEFTIRSDLIKQILTGRKHQGNVEETVGEKKSRIPITPNIMLLMKRDLAESDMEKPKKLLLWSIITLLFNGGFRVGEILSYNKSTFDPYSTLLEKDVVIKRVKVNQQEIDTLQIKL